MQSLMLLVTALVLAVDFHSYLQQLLMKTFFSGFLMLLYISGYTQTRKQALAQLPPHRFALSINPLTLINTDQTVMFGVERRLHKHWSMLGDAGFIAHSRYLQEENKTRGFEVRPALRYYYSRDGSGYVQGQLQYRYTHYELTDWLGKDCVNGVPSYEQLQEFDLQKQSFAIALVTGGIERLSPRWLLDVSVGLGLQHRSHEVMADENSCYEPRTGIFRNPVQDGVWQPVLPVAIKLAYVIR